MCVCFGLFLAVPLCFCLFRCLSLSVCISVCIQQPFLSVFNVYLYRSAIFGSMLFFSIQIVLSAKHLFPCSRRFCPSFPLSLSPFFDSSQLFTSLLFSSILFSPLADRGVRMHRILERMHINLDHFMLHATRSMTFKKSHRSPF